MNGKINQRQSDLDLVEEDEQTTHLTQLDEDLDVLDSFSNLKFYCLFLEELNFICWQIS